MKNTVAAIVVFILFIPMIICAQEQKAIGIWSGELELPTSNLELIFKISRDSTGNIIARMDVPAQGAVDLPVSEVTTSNDSLKLNVAMIAGRFAGGYLNDSTVAGTWRQAGTDFPIELKKTATLTELNRPQTPQPPFPYESREVEYMNPESGLKLAGTLTIPEGRPVSPAVILISGSGAQDRDETVFGHKPFLVIADYLTRNGIAVLRVDDRGVGGSEGNIQNATSEDFAGDVIAGIDFLKNQEEIDPLEIGLIGHSEGGLIAPIVATKSDDVAFIVLLAGPGVKGEDLLYEQNKLVLEAVGMDEATIEQNQKQQEAIFNIVLTEQDSAVRVDRLQRTLTGGMYPMLNDEQKAAADAQLQSVNTPWFRFFLSHDPYPVLTKVDVPVLALNGTKDVQVSVGQNLPAIEKALTEGGNENFEIMKLENLNHLFQEAETGGVAEYVQIEETISPKVLKIIEEWISDVTE